MKKIMSFAFFICISLFAFPSDLKIKCEKLFVMGDKQVEFRQIKAIAENDDGNVYVLDSKEKKVYHFSSDGKYLGSFGRPGEGPGDLSDPVSVVITENGMIALGEFQRWITFFDKDGNYIKKIDLGRQTHRLLNIKYVSSNMFYGEKVGENSTRTQLVCDQEGKIIIGDVNSEKYNNIIRLKNGGVFAMMFPEYSPYILDDSNDGICVMARAREYNVKLIGGDGKIKILTRPNIHQEKISKSERRWFIDRIEKKKIPPDAVSILTEQIPDSKNYINNLLVCKSGVWISRVTGDLSRQEKKIIVDYFSTDGFFKGTFLIDRWPMHITSKYLYFLEKDKEENNFISKYSYIIK